MSRVAVVSSIVLVLFFVGLAGCVSEPAPDAPGADAYAAAEAASADPAAGATGTGQRVAILDHGLRMSRGTQVVPAGWTLTQNIATDPNNGQLARYEMDVRGPNGELARGLGTGNYAGILNTTLDGTWRRLVARGLYQELQDASIGDLRPSPTLEQLTGFRRAADMGRQRGFNVQGLEAPLRGMSRGRPVEGVVYVTHITSPQMSDMGTVQVSLVFSEPERLAETLRINREMAESFEPNPAFEERVRQIGQMAMQQQEAQSRQWMANSQAQHARRMAANQAQFQAHQQMMNDRYATNDRTNQQWMDNFRSGGGTTTASGSEYTGHDAFIDGIYERNTFDDPHSDQQVHTEGYYDHWYTNSQGDYVGTNDPNFNPYPLDGDWQEIKPLEP